MTFILTQFASDNFTRADENPLNPANWQSASFGGNLQVVNNKCEGTSTDTNNSEIYENSLSPNDQYVEVTVPASGTNNSILAVLSRWSPIGPNGYYYKVTFNGSALPQSLPVQPVINSNGSQSNLGSLFNLTISAGDILRLIAFGNTLYFYQNGVQVDVRTDSTFYSGRAGLYIDPKSALTDLQVTLWAAGGVTLAPTTSTTGILRSGHGSRLIPPYGPGGHQ